MKIKNDLSFSTEVAETLGLECAIILSLYNKNELEDISTYDNLVNSLKKSLRFIDVVEIIKESINTLLNF